MQKMWVELPWYNNASTLLSIKLSTSPFYGPFIVNTMSYAALLAVLHYG